MVGMIINIKPKGIKDFIQEDESLTSKITYEEFLRVESGFDDSGIDEAYKAYKKVIEKSK